MLWKMLKARTRVRLVARQAGDRFQYDTIEIAYGERISTAQVERYFCRIIFATVAGIPVRDENPIRKKKPLNPRMSNWRLLEIWKRKREFETFAGTRTERGTNKKRKKEN